MEPVELSALMRRAADGDEQAWSAIVDDYSRLVWSVVRRFRLSEDQAADAAQTTWLRLIEHIGAIRDPARLAGWLRTTAHRTCLEMLRTSSKAGLAALLPDSFDRAVGPAADDGPEASVLRREHVALVRATLATLPARQQELMRLLLVSPPLSYAEIGERLDMPVGSIGPTRARILHKLHEALAQAGLHDLALS